MQVEADNRFWNFSNFKHIVFDSATKFYQSETMNNQLLLS